LYKYIYADGSNAVDCQVRERCRKEWTMFQSRMARAENAYYKAVGIDLFNSTNP